MNANVVSLVAQPAQGAYLCFEIGGILDARNVELGHSVNHVPYQKLCATVKSAGAGGDLSRLKGDSTGILAIAAPVALASLRNEDRKTALDSAVNTRQNVFYSKYSNSAAVISTIRAYYSRTSPASKPNRLGILSDIANQQAMSLQDAYTQDDRTGVVRSTSSSMKSCSTSSGTAERGGDFIQESVGRNVPQGTRLPHILPPAWQSIEPARFNASDTAATALTVGNDYEQSRNSGTANGSQSSTHIDYEYRTPYLEARARSNRAQISLMDQQFDSYMFEQNVPYLEQIFQNELANVDLDIYQLQLALLRSYLIAPQPGIVTGVYKNPGDPVNAGEPVLRVEDNSVVNLVATLVCYASISVGAAASVTTTLNGAGNPPTTVTGSVVAARGQASGGRWEVVVRVNNVDATGNYMLPIGYCFDAEYTQVTIS